MMKMVIGLFSLVNSEVEKQVFSIISLLKKRKKLIFQKPIYNVYKIAPINYSIASNEDIIKYIKYDIIIQFLEKNVQVDDLDLTIFKTLPGFILKSLPKFAALIASMVPKIGTEMSKVYDNISELCDKFNEYHNNLKDSDGSILANFLSKMELNESSIYENDIISKLITSILEKEANAGKKTLLIVDDLDRLDPDHVFRILNVFAAHFKDESKTGTANKFNFEKIIIVCDFKNLKSIFHHKYGNETDFVGYIDKFYATEIYHFDNKKSVINIIYKVVSSYKSDVIDENSYKRLFLNSAFIERILTLLITEEYISLRKIMKTYEMNLFSHSQIITFNDKIEPIISWRIPFALQLKLLCILMDGCQNAIRIFEIARHNNFYISNHNEYYAEAMLIMTIEKHELKKPIANFVYEGESLVIRHTQDANKCPNNIQIFKTQPAIEETNPDIPTEEISPTLEMFWSALIASTRKLYNASFINS